MPMVIPFSPTDPLFSLDDDLYLKLLLDTFEFLEQSTLNNLQEDTMLQIYQGYLPLIIERAGKTEVQFGDTLKHKIRRATLDILSVISYPNDKKHLPLNQIMDL